MNTCMSASASSQSHPSMAWDPAQRLDLSFVTEIPVKVRRSCNLAFSVVLLDSLPALWTGSMWWCLNGSSGGEP